MKYDFNFVDVLFKNKGKIVSFTVIATLIVVFLVYFLVRRWYEATIVLFPPYSNSPSRSVIGRWTQHPKQTIGEFGDIIEAERLVQVFNTQQILKKVDEKFHLRERYGIKGKKYEWYELKKKWDKNIDVKRTSNHSVVIKIRDLNPDTAALIARYVAELGDSILNSVIRERALVMVPQLKALIDSVEKDILILSAQMKSHPVVFTMGHSSPLEDMLKMYVNVFSSAFATSPQSKKTVEAFENLLLNYPDLYHLYQRLLELEIQRAFLYSKLNELQFDASVVMPQFFIIDEPIPDNRYVYPNMIVVLLLALVAPFMVACVFFILWEMLRKNAT